MNVVGNNYLKMQSEFKFTRYMYANNKLKLQIVHILIFH